MNQRSPAAVACLALVFVACARSTKTEPERDASAASALTTAPSSTAPSSTAPSSTAPSSTAPKRSSIRGTLLHGGKPLRDLPLEMCRRKEGNIYKSTPCAESPHRMTASTDASGAFAFTNVPDAEYQIFILRPPYHTQTLVNLVVQDGSVFDVGRFEVHAVDD